MESNETSTAADTSANNSLHDSNDSQTSEDSQTSNNVESTKPVVNANPDVEDFSMMLKHTLDGFLLILSNDGDITYVTANISDYLGLSKVSDWWLYL